MKELTIARTINTGNFSSIKVEVKFERLPEEKEGLFIKRCNEQFVKAVHLVKHGVLPGE